MIRVFNTAVALVFGAVITFALFFLMQLLIASGVTEPEAGTGFKIGDITIPEIEIEVQRVEPKPDEPEEPEEIPDLPDEDFQLDTPDGESLNIARVEIDLGGLDNNASIGTGDSEMLPIVIIEPQYPNRAMTRGTEGWCHVSFTVTATGSVIDPIVLDSDPPNVFDNASKRAALRFKYNPRTVDGVAVAVADVQYVFRYQLTD